MSEEGRFGFGVFVERRVFLSVNNKAVWWAL